MSDGKYTVNSLTWGLQHWPFSYKYSEVNAVAKLSQNKIGIFQQNTFNEEKTVWFLCGRVLFIFNKGYQVRLQFGLLVTCCFVGILVHIHDLLSLQIMKCCLLYRRINKLFISSQSHVIQHHCRACLRRSYCTSPSALRGRVRVRFAPSPTGRPLAKYYNII